MEFLSWLFKISKILTLLIMSRQRKNSITKLWLIMLKGTFCPRVLARTPNHTHNENKAIKKHVYTQYANRYSVLNMMQIYSHFRLLTTISSANLHRRCS